VGTGVPVEPGGMDDDTAEEEEAGAH